MRVVPTGISKTQKENYCMISFMCRVLNCQVYSIRALNGGCQEGSRLEDSEDVTDVKF